VANEKKEEPCRRLVAGVTKKLVVWADTLTPPHEIYGDIHGQLFYLLFEKSSFPRCQHELLSLPELRCHCCRRRSIHLPFFPFSSRRLILSPTLSASLSLPLSLARSLLYTSASAHVHMPKKRRTFIYSVRRSQRERYTLLYSERSRGLEIERQRERE
jgi:hypothetical protein